jgi:Tol biopolymer transport system component
VPIRFLTVALMAALTAATAGAATSPTNRPLLSYAVAPITDGAGHGSLDLGLCATDLHGHTFRLSNPDPDESLSWSPDGRSMTFIGPALADEGEPHPIDLFLADDRGRVLRNLTGDGGDGWPTGVFGWSPDSSELAANWFGFGSNSVWIEKRDGTGALSVAYGIVFGDSWSPDGKLILLSRYSDIEHSDRAISVIGADGTNERTLIAGADRGVWSPDGQEFAYASYTGSRASGLGVAQADGGNARLLLQGMNDVAGFAWSPDGDRLAYLASSDGMAGGLGVMRTDGSDAHLLATGVIGGPQWSPDGSLIAFTVGPKRTPHVRVIRPDGTDDQDVAAASDPAWRAPAPLPSHRRPCIVRGTPRADVIHGTSMGDVILAGRGADRVYGSGGPDVIVGGLGPDRLWGGSGEDRFGARDRTRDYVQGGAGWDFAYVDGADVRFKVEGFRLPK